MNIVEIEQATRKTWPVLEQKELPCGVLRYANGVSRRSNSLSIHPNCQLNGQELQHAAEDFFGCRERDSIIRVLGEEADASCDFRRLDEFLASQSYELQAPSKLMLLELTEEDEFLLDGKAGFEQVSLTEWLPLWHKFSTQSVSSFAVYQSMLGKISSPHCYGVLRNRHKKIVSCGMAVSSGVGIGLSCIATSEDFRGQGNGELLVRGLLKWGLDKKAAYCFLQVESENETALNLYQRMGFHQLYSYWYRVKKFNSRET